jgi:PKD repeat protein
VEKKTILCIILLIASMIATIPISHVAQAQTQPSVVFDPSTVSATQINQTFTLNIDISNVQNLWGWAVNVTFDSEYVKFQSSSEGNFLTSQVESTFYFATKPTNYIDPYSNIETLKLVTLDDAVSSYSNGEEQSASGSGVLSTLTFQAIKQTASTPITLNVGYLEGPLPTNASVDAINPTITPTSTSSTATVSLIVPGPPTANAGQEQSVPVGTTVIFNGSQSVSSGSTNYTWTFIDGTLKTLTGMIANYTFNNPGNYTVTLTVADSLGTSNSTVLIHVIGSAATATPTPNTTATQTPSASTTPTPTSTLSPTPTQTQTTGSLNLPPIVLGILVIITILILAGSFSWLRKQT